MAELGIYVSFAHRPGVLGSWLLALAAILRGPSLATAEDGLYLGPIAVAATRDGALLLVACYDAKQVLWVDAVAGKLTRRANLHGRPAGICLSPDEKRVLITDSAPDSHLVIMELETGRVVASIPLGHTATSPVVSPDGSRCYVCERFDNDVAVVDLTAGRVIRRVPMVREPIAAALTPDGKQLLVANHLANMRTDVTILDEVTPIVTVMDTESFATTQLALPNGSNGLRDICVSRDGTHAFVTHLLSNYQELPFRVTMGWINTNVLSVIDTQQHKVLSTVGFDDMDHGSANPWGVAVAPDGSAVCVTLAGSHELAVIDHDFLLSEQARLSMSPMMGVWPIYLGLGESYWQKTPSLGRGPRGLAIAGSTVFVADYFSDAITVFHLKKGQPPSRESIPLGPAPKLTLRRRGELLFHDASICEQRWQSCASCHPDGRTDSLNWDLMNDGTGNPKNTKSLLLAHRTPPAMAEGVRSNAEVAVRSGILNILFTDRPEEDAVAIDEYLRSLQPVPSPHLVNGHLSSEAERGRELFYSASIGCYRCHPAPLYTDRKLHNVGTRSRKEVNDRFDTPTLVEVWRTAPYLHDGRYVTIEQLLVEGRHGLRKSVPLTDSELHDLIEFVLSL